MRRLMGMAAFFCCLPGCAIGKFYLSDKSIDSSLFVLPVEETRKVTISATPFTVAENASIKNKGNIVKYEQSFLPLNLLNVLKKSPYVQDAYFSPIGSPATD